jgi:hypothetical protein
VASYLVLIYEDEAAVAAAAEADLAARHAAHGTFMRRHGAAVRGGNALEPTTTATSLRASGTQITDGAFAETKEALGGYYLIEAADLDAALAIAGDVPAPFGGVEIRPVRSSGNNG